MSPCVNYLAAIGSLFQAIAHAQLLPPGPKREQVIEGIQVQIGVLEKEYAACVKK